MTSDASRPSGTPIRSGGKALENKETDERGVRLTTIAGKLPGLDSNQDEQNQNLLCYRYTTG